VCDIESPDTIPGRANIEHIPRTTSIHWLSACVSVSLSMSVFWSVSAPVSLPAPVPVPVSLPVSACAANDEPHASCLRVSRVIHQKRLDVCDQVGEPLPRHRHQRLYQDRGSLSRYGVASVSRINKIIGLFCKRAL